jgi:hypothetical protein
MPTKPQDIAVADLLLDADNPRLPEDRQGTSQATLLRYLYDNSALDELVRSLADNGFFQHEPLIAVAGPGRGKYTALEGNRRLAALKILLGVPEAKEEEIEPDLDEKPTKRRLDELAAVPCYVVADREEVHKYLGFRHIGGIKTWSAESKARYLVSETDRAADQGSENPFNDVARRVGSNVQGVRNSYLALTVLRNARDEFAITVQSLLERRFGVWLRCMNSQDIRAYIGLDSPRSYQDVRTQVKRTDGAHLSEVVADISPREEGRPLLSDSRDVTIYGEILHNKVAHAALRKYESMTIPKQIVELAELPQRLASIRSQIEVAQTEAQQAEPSAELLSAAEALAAAARALRATVRDRREDIDDD